MNRNQKKLDLADLQVKSFITNLAEERIGTVKGGHSNTCYISFNDPGYAGAIQSIGVETAGEKTVKYCGTTEC